MSTDVAAFVFHLPRSWLGPMGSGILPFYQKLGAGLIAGGHEVRQIPLDRETVMDKVAGDDAFHVINHGRFSHPRVRNAGIAYVFPFWNMDPAGIRAFSSIARADFVPSTIDGDVARPFMRRLRKRLIGQRISRYEQPEDMATVPEGCTAVFLQSEGHRIVGETLYLDRWEMLETVCAAAAQGPVVVKPHPRDFDPETGARLEELCARFPQLVVSTANIHDILDAATRVVTINSAVGIEAYLHRKPVILCGQADFHHIADVARSADDLATMLRTEPRRRAYDKFIWWYFGHHCLSTTEPDLVGRFLMRFGVEVPG